MLVAVMVCLIKFLLIASFHILHTVPLKLGWFILTHFITFKKVKVTFIDSYLEVVLAEGSVAETRWWKLSVGRHFQGCSLFVHRFFCCTWLTGEAGKFPVSLISLIVHLWKSAFIWPAFSLLLPAAPPGSRKQWLLYVHIFSGEEAEIAAHSSAPKPPHMTSDPEPRARAVNGYFFVVYMQLPPWMS